MPATSAPPIRVAIVEDDRRVRETLSDFIGHAAGFCCLQAWPDAESALAELPRQRPDVVLMDIHLPGMSGIDCARALKTALPGVSIVMLTAYDEGDFLFQSLQAGASGYLLKRTPGDKLLEAITEARLGGVPLTRQMAAKLSEYFQKLGAVKTELGTLTRREHETLALLADGLRYKEIADRLGIGLDTVREYVRNIYAKLHVTSRTEAVVKFLQR